MRDLTEKQKVAIKQIAWGRVRYGKRCAIHKRIVDQLAARELVVIALDKYNEAHIHLTPAGRVSAMSIDPEYKAFQEER